jgi:hypothetical protein
MVFPWLKARNHCYYYSLVREAKTRFSFAGRDSIAKHFRTNSIVKDHDLIVRDPGPLSHRLGAGSGIDNPSIQKLVDQVM